MVAACISHVAHLLSVLVLFTLTLAVFPRSTSGFAFTVASLHIISPAGIFLSAPYAESMCALLSFTGILIFQKSVIPKGQSTLVHDFYVLLSGVLFGVATTFRSNAILNGLLLLEEAIRTFMSLSRGLRLSTVRRLIATGLGGISVAAGLLLPQYISYSEYCRETGVASLRPWCGKLLPSIYTFVQDHYWYAIISTPTQLSA